MENLILILIGLLSIFFIWLLWARQQLLHHLRSFERREKMLRFDLQKRRDRVPYLLESFRSKAEITPQWTALLEQRKAFHDPSMKDLKLEMQFAQSLNGFIMSNELRDLNYLEAEKRIKDMNEIVDRAKQEWAAEHQHFLALEKRFPYSLASAIFGVRI